MMILYFKNSAGSKSIVSEPRTEKRALRDIRKFCKERNYEIPYIRFWDKSDGTLTTRTYDVGSHTEFFILEGVN